MEGNAPLMTVEMTAPDPVTLRSRLATLAGGDPASEGELRALFTELIRSSEARGEQAVRDVLAMVFEGGHPRWRERGLAVRHLVRAMHALVAGGDMDVDAGATLAVFDPAERRRLCDGLEEFEELFGQAGDVALIRVHAGLELDEIAALQGRTPRETRRDWRFARAWLWNRLRRSE